jgi:ethanolamine utilization protein EutQ
MATATGRVLTAAHVRDAAAAGTRELLVPAAVRITPLARDTAREVGITLVPQARAARTPPDELESRVRAIVASVVGDGPAPTAARTTGGPRRKVRHVDGRDVTLAPFPYPGPEPGQDVRSADVVTSRDGSPVAAGFLTLTRGCFPWTLTYDEVQYVIEGELHLGTPEGTVVGRPGDVLFVPAGTSITFGTPSWARFLYVTYPADWEEGIR